MAAVSHEDDVKMEGDVVDMKDRKRRCSKTFFSIVIYFFTNRF